MPDAAALELSRKRADGKPEIENTTEARGRGQHWEACEKVTIYCAQDKSQRQPGLQIWKGTITRELEVEPAT